MTDPAVVAGAVAPMRKINRIHGPLFRRWTQGCVAVSLEGPIRRDGLQNLHQLKAVHAQGWRRRQHRDEPETKQQGTYQTKEESAFAAFSR